MRNSTWNPLYLYAFHSSTHRRACYGIAPKRNAPQKLPQVRSSAGYLSTTVSERKLTFAKPCSMNGKESTSA